MHTDQAFLLPPYFEYMATYLWASSGAMLAARRGYAIMGILTIALVSATGGGLLRDGLFLQTHPALLETPIYLQLIVLASLMVMLLGGRVSHWKHYPQLLGMVDALGLGGYAAVGMSKALVQGLPLVSVALVGLVNAVGGGIVRDVLLNQKISMFQPGPMEEALALFGCIFFLALHKGLGVGQLQASWSMILLVFLLRLAAIRLQVNSRPLAAFAPYTE